MRRGTHDRRTRRPQPLLKFQQLELRHLMAADLVPIVVPDEISTDDRDVIAIAQSDTLPTQAIDAVAPVSQQRMLVIPMTLAEPRSFDGTGNNLVDSELGSVGQRLMRVADADYDDGVATPAGADRPSARVVSNALAAQDDETASDRQLSAFIYAWGQFVDHDIDLTEPPETDRELFAIEVPKGDDFFDPEGTDSQVIELYRSRFDDATGTDASNPREQINEITAWIDGSGVYGSDQATADSLRTFKGGMLRTSDGNLPPTDDDGNFVAGDVRANENVELTSMHTLFIREHNWWAARIARQHPELGDEAIYQQARAIVIAEIQAITFNEFLPALLGPDAISPYRGYDPMIDPSIANEFSTAGFRMHTLINDDVEFFGNDGRAVSEEIELADAFFNPALLRETGPDTILKYLASTQSQEFDVQLVDSLRNFLFGQPGQGGFDLASLNIQRGRDHGLADYNSVREAYGLARVESFADISSDPEIQQKLEQLYGSVDNIDLWVGALSEDHLPGSSVGELTQTIVADQFERLRDGDRFWYQNIFSGPSLRMLESTSLSDVIARNTSINNLQQNVFFMFAEVSGQVFVDGNGNGRQDRREQGLGGVKVELLDDEGSVVATTTTNARGRYQFDTFRETGDYQVRVVVPNRFQVASGDVVELLISRGGETVTGVDFALGPVRRTAADRPRDRNAVPQATQLAALDAALADTGSICPMTIFNRRGMNGIPRRAPR
jgi:peroxidase